jgi:hypothetical protein
MKNRGNRRCSHPCNLGANMCMFVAPAVHIRKCLQTATAFVSLKESPHSLAREVMGDVATVSDGVRTLLSVQ